MKTFGIDVSKWQGNFDFQRAKNEGVKFVILRGAYNKTKDKMFDTYYEQCKNLNLPVGVYQYSLAVTENEARKEAEYLYKYVLKGRKFELPIYIDIEEKSQLALSKTALTKVAKAWCEYLEEKGYYVGIYASASTFMCEMNDTEMKKYTHWIAQWSKKCTYSGNVDMWQFGGETNHLRSTLIAGQTVDQNYMYKDFPAIIKKAGLNGYTNSFPKADYNGVSLIEGLRSVGANTTYAYRKRIAAANGVKNYTGTAAQNTELLNKLKQGKLIKP